ncbi:hypothetical protein BV898_11715 [Hypsibius exemplaris]|uniref:WAP domain-containing protein n=1 Tax=Hypsibius exemplaris TaxID=2072580 RepID=A0A1W0WFQ5_HYPEX|nr:hypothetical protein BV898_11715 [Hypsibius exemplaris]
MHAVAIVSAVLLALVAVSSAQLVVPDGSQVHHACNTVRCRSGYRCIERQDTSQFCILIGICPKVAQCVLNHSPLEDERTSPLQCPSTEGMWGICVEQCSSDTDCQAGFKCCNNGCGHSCLKAV